MNSKRINKFQKSVKFYPTSTVKSEMVDDFPIRDS